MKLDELRIFRENNYRNTPEPLQGYVELSGDSGQQKIRLSAGAMGRIITVIREEVEKSAIKNAKMVPKAVQDAIDEPLLLESDGAITGDDDLI